jgi:hypothetical protein
MDVLLDALAIRKLAIVNHAAPWPLAAAGRGTPPVNPVDDGSVVQVLLSDGLGRAILPSHVVLPDARRAAPNVPPRHIFFP